MKITFIIATLGNGGAERVLVTLANAFCEEHEVTILKFHAENSFYPLKQNIKVFTLRQFRFDNIYNKIASRFKKFFALKKAMKESKADIFISFLDTTNIACIYAKIGLKTPLIISEHSSQVYLKSKIWRFFRRLAYPHADALSVLTKNDEEYYKNFVKKVLYLPNPCHFNLENKKLQKENLVLFIGRLDKNKNASMFLKMVANLDENTKKDYEFVIAGDGEERANLENLAKILSINVKFLGRVNDVKNLYERAKAICLCSFVEGLPTILIESLYFEVCRIATFYESGAEELINNKFDGILVPCDDAIAMSKALSEVLNDENLRQGLVQNAKKRCIEFDITNVKTKWLELMKDVQNA